MAAAVDVAEDADEDEDTDTMAEAMAVAEVMVVNTSTARFSRPTLNEITITTRGPLCHMTEPLIPKTMLEGVVIRCEPHKAVAAVLAPDLAEVCMELDEDENMTNLETLR